jgi:sRNA-binding carbon storage regulator CsrA
MLKHLEGQGIVALTIRSKDAVAIHDENGKRVAVIALGNNQLGKVRLVIQAPKQNLISREKHETD